MCNPLTLSRFDLLNLYICCIRTKNSHGHINSTQCLFGFFPHSTLRILMQHVSTESFYFTSCCAHNNDNFLLLLLGCFEYVIIENIMFVFGYENKKHKSNMIRDDGILYFIQSLTCCDHIPEIVNTLKIFI